MSCSTNTLTSIVIHIPENPLRAETLKNKGILHFTKLGLLTYEFVEERLRLNFEELLIRT